MIANYRFLGVDSDTLSTVYNIDQNQPSKKASLPRAIKQSFQAVKIAIVASRALSFLRKHTAALLPSKPVKAQKER